MVDSDNIEEVMAGSKKSIFLRSIRIIGFLHKTFDFDKKEISAGLDFKIKAETYEKLLSLVTIEMLDLQMAVLSALGMLMVQEPSFMLMDMTKVTTFSDIFETFALTCHLFLYSRLSTTACSTPKTRNFVTWRFKTLTVI